MSRYETVGKDNWREFLASPTAVLVLGKTDCEHCKTYSAELEGFLQPPGVFPGVRFGKIELDRPGLIEFKRENPWISELDVLPYTIIYARGARQKEFAGGGVDRLETRLRRVLNPELE